MAFVVRTRQRVAFVVPKQMKELQLNSPTTEVLAAPVGPRPQSFKSRESARTWPWLREPLLHFVLAGGALFLADHWFVSKKDDPKLITVGPVVDQEARALFKSSKGREPDAAELAALRQTWLDNEVLYREGLALQVDRGDSAIRERVIFKALSIVDANVKAPPLDDAALRAWFEERRDRYDEPARFDFQEAVLAGNDRSQATARSFADNLNKGTPGDAQAGLRVYKGRPLSNLVQSYGADFAKAMERATVGAWQAHATNDGWRVMRLEGLHALRPAQFEVVRGLVLQDFTDQKMSEQRTAAVRQMATKYKVVQEGAKP